MTKIRHEIKSSVKQSLVYCTPFQQTNKNIQEYTVLLAVYEICIFAYKTNENSNMAHYIYI